MYAFDSKCCGCMQLTTTLVQPVKWCVLSAGRLAVAFALVKPCTYHSIAWHHRHTDNRAAAYSLQAATIVHMHRGCAEQPEASK